MSKKHKRRAVSVNGEVWHYTVGIKNSDIPLTGKNIDKDGRVVHIWSPAKKRVASVPFENVSQPIKPLLKSGITPSGVKSYIKNNLV